MSLTILPCNMPMISKFPPDLACIAIFSSASAEIRTLRRYSAVVSSQSPAMRLDDLCWIALSVKVQSRRMLVHDLERTGGPHCLK